MSQIVNNNVRFYCYCFYQVGAMLNFDYAYIAIITKLISEIIRERYLYSWARQ